MARIVSVHVRMQIQDYVNKARAGVAATKDLRTELQKAAAAGKLEGVATAATGAGLALVAGFTLATTAAARFEKAMSGVSSVTNANAVDLERLRKAALEAGKATQFSATEAAQAERELGAAGLATSQIVGGALTGSLALAAAGQLDLAESADIAAKTMGVFGLQGRDVGRVADVLSAAANKSATGVREIAEALKMGGGAANSAGMSLEETVGTLAALSKGALVGSDAGTSLKTALTMLAAPTKESAAEMKRLGIEVYDTNGNFIGSAKLAGVLQRTLGGLTQQQRQAALSTIFGADAMRVAIALYDLGEQQVQEYITAVDDQGAASRAAAKLTDNLIGDVERLTGSFETLTITSGGGVSEALRIATKSAGAFVDQLNEAPPALTGTLVGVAGLTGAVLLGVAAWTRIRGSINDALEDLSKTGPAGERAARGLTVATKWAGRAGAAFATLEIVNTIAAQFRPAAADTDALARSLTNLANSGERAGEWTRIFGGDMDQLKRDLKFTNSSGGIAGLKKAASIEPGFLAGFDWSTQASYEHMVALDKAFAQLASSGNSKEAAKAFEVITKAAKEQGIPVEDLINMFPQYKAALEESATSTDRLAAGQQAALAQAHAMAGGLEAAVKEAGSLSAAFDKLNKSTTDWAKSENDLEAAIDDGMAAIKANGKTATDHGTVLDASTKAARGNRDALLEIVDTTRDAIQARWDDTHSLEAANSVYEDGRKAFVKAAVAAGLTKKAAEELADAWLQMPPLVSTQVTTPGLDAALAKLQRLAQMDKKMGISINVYDPEGLVTRRWGGVTTHAQTGLLRDAAVYSPRTPARYAFAEPATGGEAFIPRKGPYGRAMSILSESAAWYDAAVIPFASLAGTRAAPSYGAAGSPAAMQSSVHMEAAIARALRAAMHGISIVLDERRVGHVQARKADLYKRGG